MEQLSSQLIWQQWHWFLKLERHLLLSKLVIWKFWVKEKEIYPVEGLRVILSMFKGFLLCLAQNLGSVSNNFLPTSLW